MLSQPSGWTDDDERRLIELLRAEDGPKLRDWLARVIPSEPTPMHLEPSVALWERTRHEPVRGIVEQPPGTGKTSTGLRGLVWRIDRDPAVTHGYVTYGGDLARDKSRIALDLAVEAGVELHPKMRNLNAWRTRYGGGLLATSIGGALTGFRVDSSGVVLFDDFFKDRSSAESKAARNEAWEFFSQVAYTRIRPSSSIIIQATRWHTDDPIGRLEALQKAGKLKGPPWERIKLRAIAREDDMLGRPVGAPLWPEEFPLSFLEEVRAIIGEYGWASLYDQEPTPRGHKLFGEPARFQMAEFREYWRSHPLKLMLFCDPAITAETRADYSVISLVAVEGTGAHARMWVVDSWRGQVEMPELVRRLRAMQSQWKVAIGVEAVGGFKAVPQALRSQDRKLRIVELHPKGDKFVRAQGLSAAWNAGRVMIPLDAEWADACILEHQDFTGSDGEKDDQVDALSSGWNYLVGGVEAVKRGSHADAAA